MIELNLKFGSVKEMQKALKEILEGINTNPQQITNNEEPKTTEPEKKETTKTTEPEKKETTKTYEVRTQRALRMKAASCLKSLDKEKAKLLEQYIISLSEQHKVTKLTDIPDTEYGWAYEMITKKFEELTDE